MQKPSGPFLNLCQDVAFKAYFKSNSEVLSSLLKAFLPLPKGHKIKQVDILDSYMPQLKSQEKQSILDLRVLLNKGLAVNVEMQYSQKKDFIRRILFYWSKLYALSFKKGRSYGQAFPAYSLIFVNFDIFKEQADFFHSFSIRSDKKPYFMLIGDLRIVIVELAKFRSDRENLLDLRDKWCYMLKESGNMSKEELEILSKEAGMKSAVDHLFNFSKDEQMRILEEARDKNRRDRLAEKEYVFEQGMEKGMKQGIEKGMEQGIEKGMEQGIEKGMEKGMEQGMEKGMEQGIEKGMEQGIEKGIEQGMEKGMEKGQKALVLNMLAKGLSVKDIVKWTGLKAQQISKIQKEK